MSARPVLQAACDAYLAADRRLARTPAGSPAHQARRVLRDLNHDRLAQILARHGAVFHHHGTAFWAASGVLQRSRPGAVRGRRD